MMPHDETEALARRYACREAADPRYSLFKPDVWHTVQERQRAMLRVFARQRLTEPAALRLVEVGCGGGGNLLELLRLGFRPEHLVGIELLPQRLEQARALLPAALVLHGGDATRVQMPPQSQHIAFVSTVFSSLLDDAFQQRLADAMWRWVAPGGGVLWYDFTFDNPRNTHVRGVPVSRIGELFPHGRLSFERVTLAPPIARRVVRVHPGLYTVFNAVPLLRTHVLAWIAKPE